MFLHHKSVTLLGSNVTKLTSVGNAFLSGHYQIHCLTKNFVLNLPREKHLRMLALTESHTDLDLKGAPNDRPKYLVPTIK